MQGKSEKIKNSEKIKIDTIELCRECLGQKLISVNQPINFQWETFPEDIAILAKMLIAENGKRGCYGKYKTETIQKIAYSTALSVINEWMDEIKAIGPLPVRIWRGDNEKFRDIFISCTTFFLMSWPYYYYKKTGNHVSDNPYDNSNNMSFIKNEALELALNLSKEFFSKSSKIQEDLYNQVKLFYNNYENNVGTFMIITK